MRATGTSPLCEGGARAEVRKTRGPVASRDPTADARNYITYITVLVGFPSAVLRQVLPPASSMLTHVN